MMDLEETCLGYWILKLGNFVANPCDLRSFLARAYPTMKKNNPNTPIMLREAAGTQPRVYARYGMFRDPKAADIRRSCWLRG